MLRRSIWVVLLVGFVLATCLPTCADSRFITVASTTSTEHSGLFGHILPLFHQATGIEARVVAVGTGQAMQIAERGDADVLFVHHKPSEEKFVDAGFGVARYDVMYNDFILVGPQTDPAGVKDMQDIIAALTKIATQRAAFVSRGDDSGTHKLERSLWQAAGIDVATASGTWYREAGAGMGATLNLASAMNGYTLTDRGTWISFQNKGELTLQVAGDRRLFNQYGVILVNPERHQHIKAQDGQAFINWLLSPQGQQAIADYRIEGQQLFFPNAKGSSS